MNFPISHDYSVVLPEIRRHWPRYVPWWFVEQWRSAIEDNHGRTLEQLARYGGLTPMELWLAAHSRDLSDAGMVTEHVAARWMIAELSK